jgi:hypothetical protein
LNTHSLDLFVSAMKSNRKCGNVVSKSMLISLTTFQIGGSPALSLFPATGAEVCLLYHREAWTLLYSKDSGIEAEFGKV